MSTPDSAYDSQILKRLGNAALQNVEAMTIYVLSYGVLIVLFGASVSTAWRQGFSSKITAVFFSATVLSFVLYTLQVGAQIATSIILMRKYLVEQTNLSLPQRQGLAEKAVEVAGIVTFWTINLIRLINNLWRAWVLFRHRQWVMTLPFLLWLATLGTTLGDLGLVSTSWGLDNYRDGSSEDIFFAMTLILSVTTNCLTTFVVALKLWARRALVVKTFSCSRRKTQDILVMLVDSGFTYAVLQITFMAANFNQYVIDNFVATVAFEDIDLALSALLPTLMILIVQRQRSVVDLLNAVNDTKAHDEHHLPDYVEGSASHEMSKLRSPLEP